MSIAATLVRSARAQAGLSRRTLAAKADVPTSTVSRIEDAKSEPTVAMLEQLLAAAGCRLVLSLADMDDEPTLAELATAGSDRRGRLRIDWTRLRGFADWAARHPRDLEDALRDPPIRTDTPLDAILAAFAEQLAIDSGIPAPRWTRAVGRLDEPWSPPGTPRMRSIAEQETTDPFRRRNVILAMSALFRGAA